MNIVQQTRHQFYSAVGSVKVRNIRAFELLCQRATACHYNRRWEDRSIPGLRGCIKGWLTMEGIEFIDDEHVIIVEAEFALETLGTHRSNNVRPSTYHGNFELVKIYSLWDFLTWYDRTFTIDF